MTTLRATALLALVVSSIAALSASPSQLQEFRMAAQIEHFDITCAPEFDGRAAVVGRRSENAYRCVASSLQHDLSFRPLLVLFATRAEQLQAIETRTVPGNREHVLVALDIPDAGLDGNLLHELSHELARESRNRSAECLSRNARPARGRFRSRLWCVPEGPA